MPAAQNSEKIVNIFRAHLRRATTYKLKSFVGKSVGKNFRHFCLKSPVPRPKKADVAPLAYNLQHITLFCKIMTRKYNGLFRKNVIDKFFDEMGQNKHIAEFSETYMGG